MAELKTLGDSNKYKQFFEVGYPALLMIETGHLPKTTSPLNHLLTSLYIMYKSATFRLFQLQYNEGPRDWQIVFAITRFRYIEVLFSYMLLLLEWRKSFVISRTSLYRGLLYRSSTLVKHHQRKTWLRQYGEYPAAINLTSLPPPPDPKAKSPGFASVQTPSRSRLDQV